MRVRCSAPVGTGAQSFGGVTLPATSASRRAERDQAHRGERHGAGLGNRAGRLVVTTRQIVDRGRRGYRVGTRSAVATLDGIGGHRRPGHQGHEATISRINFFIGGTLLSRASDGGRGLTSSHPCYASPGPVSMATSQLAHTQPTTRSERAGTEPHEAAGSESVVQPDTRVGGRLVDLAAPRSAPIAHLARASQGAAPRGAACRAAVPPAAGLCARCRHAQLVPTPRSVFWLLRAARGTTSASSATRACRCASAPGYEPLPEGEAPPEEVSRPDAASGRSLTILNREPRPRSESSGRRDAGEASGQEGDAAVREPRGLEARRNRAPRAPAGRASSRAFQRSVCRPAPTVPSTSEATRRPPRS